MSPQAQDNTQRRADLDHVTGLDRADCDDRADYDGILADMVKDGGDLEQQCQLWLFNCMLASHFPERLSF